MARLRSPSGAQEDDPERTVQLRAVRPSGAHRLPAPPAASVCGRATVVAVAAGAVVAAGQTLISPFVATAAPQPVSALLPVSETITAAPGGDPAAQAIGGDQLATNALSFANAMDPASAVDVKSLAKATEIGQQLAKQAALVESAEAGGALDAHVLGNEVFVRPATGTFTSGFGGRWGVVHYGIDIANAIGTPIYAYSDGVVEDAGPASGFGLWVVLRHPDGTHTVYGHVNRMFVKVGQQVKAGQQIAEIGNRGESTGPHLHFEVWAPDGTKINPIPWLAARGIVVGGASTSFRP
ncbi:MAG TPA: peptidoglycan DD-metalloendopeptidase family protein [Pseudonocardia sp.]